MLKRFMGLCVTFSAAALLGACSSMTEYERHVQDWEPVYCYKSIGAVQCYKEPKHSDSRRLVNFYGPAPREYDTPDEPELSRTRAPKMIKTWVKDPEPVPVANVPTTQAPSPVAQTGQSQIILEPEKEEVSFMDGVLRSLFGKPELANKPAPVAATTSAKANIVLQPAPPAQPVASVQSGTL